MTLPRPIRWLASVMAVTGAAVPVHAQQASPWLPADHWTTAQLVRQRVLGGADIDPVARLQTHAAAASALPAEYVARLVVERRPVSGAGTLHVETAARLGVRSEVLRPGGYTLAGDWAGPEAVRDAATPGVRVRATAAPRSWLALTSELTATADAVALEHGTVAAAVGAIGAWIGRRSAGYRPGAGGGLVVHALDRFDGAGFGLTRPAALPVLGFVSGEVMSGPVRRNGLVADPWLLAMRVHVRPHPRLDAGGTRAALFGAIDGAHLGVREVATVLVGANLSGRFADDQVASIDVRWRPPLDVTPIELYGEWGIHDIDAGVFFDVPAFTVGARTRGVSIEHTQISGSCCGNPPWYHHLDLADGWVADGAPLGHPLGGQGREWRLGVTGAVHSAAIVFDAAGALRSRGAENVFAPDRAGRAWLVDAAIDVQQTDRLGAELRLLTERGASWTEVRAHAVLRWRL